MSSKKQVNYVCTCGKRTTTTNPIRAEARLCSTCLPNIDDLNTQASEAAETAEIIETPAAETTETSEVTSQTVEIISEETTELEQQVQVEVTESQPEQPTDAPLASSSELEAETTTEPGEQAESNATIPTPESVELTSEIFRLTEQIEQLSEDINNKRQQLRELNKQLRIATGQSEPRRNTEPRMSLLDAAAAVLTEIAAPMQVKPLYDEITSRGLWTPPYNGKTPHLTLGAVIGRDIKENGANSRFIKPGAGLFAANPNVTAEEIATA